MVTTNIFYASVLLLILQLNIVYLETLILFALFLYKLSVFINDIYLLVMQRQNLSFITNFSKTYGPFMILMSDNSKTLLICLSVTCDRSLDFSGTTVSSTNKTNSHNTTEILLKVALNTITLTLTMLIQNKSYATLISTFDRIQLQV